MNLGSEIRNKWKTLRKFAFKNKSFVDFFFTTVYFIQQTILILLVKFFPSQIDLIVSIFALFVLTTFAIQKMVMESRIRILEKRVSKLRINVDEIAKDYMELDAEHRQTLKLLKELQEYLELRKF